MDLFSSKNRRYDLMAGYKIRLLLYSNIETWRELSIPKDINFKQLHTIIQKLFGFDDYHNYEFQIPHDLPDEDYVDLNNIIRTIDYADCENVDICEIFDQYSIALYVYDFGDNWEIIVQKLEDIDYDKKTALINDYHGKYNPIDNMGGLAVFEEIIEAIEEGEVDYILEDYGLSKGDLSKMDFEKKYKIGSRIRIN